MATELSTEYLELLLAMLEAAAEASIDTGRFVSQKVAKSAVKPPYWRPADQKEWDHHVRLKGNDGQTIGFVDRASKVIGKIWDHNAHHVEPDRRGNSELRPTEGVEAKEDLLLLGGGGYAIEEPAVEGKVKEATLVSGDEARRYAEDDLGWQWAEDGQQVSGYRPVVAEGVSVDVSSTSAPVVAVNAHVHEPEFSEYFVPVGVVKETSNNFVRSDEVLVHSSWDDRVTGADFSGMRNDSWSDVVGAGFDPVMDRVEPARVEPDVHGWD